MAVDSSNIVLGPCEWYLGPWGATEPPDSDVTPDGVANIPPDPWVDFGGTDGGVSFEIDSEFTDLTVDQLLLSPGARLTGVTMTCTGKLAEVTLDNLSNALNQIAVPVQGSGYRTLDIPVGKSSTQPKYSSLLIDGWAPELSNGEPALRRIIIRKVLSKAKVGLMHDKKTQQGIDTTWMVYYTSDSIAPVHIVDQDE